MMPSRPLHYFSICLSSLKMGPTERLALSWGNARQFTKLLLSLLSHIGEMAWRAEACYRCLDESAYALCASARQPSLAATQRAKAGGSPRCCPVLCGLRDRCIAAMLATRTRREGGV